MALLNDEEFEKVLDELSVLRINNEYDKYLQHIDEYDLWDVGHIGLYMGLLEAYVYLGKEDEAEQKFTEISDYYLANLDYLYDEYEKGEIEYEDIEMLADTDLYNKAKGLIFKLRGDFYGAAMAFKEIPPYDGVGSYLYRLLKEKDEREIQRAYEQYIQKFDTLPYEERKVITMTNTKELFRTENLTLLQMGMLPANVKFPITHPKRDHTYICHPWNNNIYLPIEDYDVELLNDRINEYCYIMQCLGATHIQIKNRKGESLSEQRKRDANYRANGSYKVFGASGNYSESTNGGEDSQSRFSFAKEQIFNPTQKPFIPENLIWFPHEAAWQRLAQQRLDGAILQHSEMVSSSQNKVFSQSEIEDINADLNILFVELGGGRKTGEDYTISMNEEVEWEISVKFKPIEDFDKVSNTDFTSISETIYVEEVTSSHNFTNEEEQFMEEVKYMLEDDDKIDEREGQILERFRIRFNISESRAEELKNIVLSSMSTISLTNEEKEYLKDYEMFIRDGEIQERERRMLNRLAMLLGISEERAMELERNNLS